MAVTNRGSKTLRRRRNKREQQTSPREERKSSTIATLLLPAIVGLIFGVVGGLSTDYLKTYIHFLDISDVRAYMLVLGAYKGDFELQLVLANTGNRQGAISELTFGYSSKKYGEAYSPIQSVIQGVPALLNPGDMRLVTLKGMLPINAMYENGSPVNQSARSDEHEVALTLHFRALDFRGQRYAGKWDIGSMSVTSANIAGWGLYSYALSIFDKQYFSGENIWLLFPQTKPAQP